MQQHKLEVSSPGMSRTQVSDVVLSDSSISNCEDGIYGAVLGGLTGITRESFMCVNSTLTRCFRNGPVSHVAEWTNAATCNTSVTSDCTGTSRITLSASAEYSFLDCTFTGCSATNDHGGAIKLVGTNSSYAPLLRISRCSFTNCYCKQTSSSTKDVRGGAIHCSYTQTFLNTRCNFTSCNIKFVYIYSEIVLHGGALSCLTISTHFVASSCLFSNCSTAVQGGGVYPAGLKFTPPSGYSCCTGCLFFNCTAAATSDSGSVGKGGGAYLRPQIAACIRECFFFGCNACLSGGGLRWYFDKANQESNSFIYTSLFRENNVTRSDYRYGHDISLYNTTTNIISNYSFSLTGSGQRVSLTDSSNQDSWLPTPSAVYVRATSRGSSCTDPNYSQCTTLALAASSSSASNLCIYLVDASLISDTSSLSVTSTSKKIIVTSYTLSAYSTITIGSSFTSSVLFSVAGGSITLLSFHILIAKNWASTNSVVNVTSGSFVMIDVTISSTTSHSFSSPVISVSGTRSLSVSQSQLSLFTQEDLAL